MQRKQVLLHALFFAVLTALACEFQFLKIKLGPFSQNFSLSEIIMLISIPAILFFCRKTVIEFAGKNRILLMVSAAFIFSLIISTFFSSIPKIFPAKWIIRYILILTVSWEFALLYYTYKIKLSFVFLNLFIFAFALSVMGIIEANIASVAEAFSQIFRNTSSLTVYGRYRAAAMLMHSNIYGCFMAFAVIFGVYLKNKEKINSVFYWVANSLIIIALVHSHSRNAMMVLILPLLFLLFKKEYRKNVLISLLILFIAIPVFTASISRLQNTYNINEGSTRSRILLWKSAINMFKSSPVIGVGPGNYNKLLKYFGVKDLIEGSEKHDIMNEEFNAHNGFFNMLAETGLLGISILITTLVFYFLRLYSIYGIKPPDFIYSVFLVLLLPFAADAFLYSYFFMIIFTSILLILINGRSKNNE